MAAEKVSGGRASFATVRCTLRPRDWPCGPHIRRALPGQNCRLLHSTEPCHSESRKASPRKSPVRRPRPFPHGPQGARRHSVHQAPCTGSASRPPTCQPLRRANPKTPIARDEQASNITAGEMLTRRRLPGDCPHPIETKQAKFGTQPDITIGSLSNRRDPAFDKSISDRPGSVRILTDVERRVQRGSTRAARQQNAQRQHGSGWSADYVHRERILSYLMFLQTRRAVLRPSELQL